MRVREAIRASEIVVTDPVILEVMAGVRWGLEDKVLRLLSEQDYEPVAARVDWVDAAAMYRGAASGCHRPLVRRLPDRCCRDPAYIPVLHLDRDFDAIATCTALQLAM